MSQKKLLSELKENDLEFTQKQKHPEVNIVEITKNVTKVKEDNSFPSNSDCIDEWDNWHPDSY